MFTFVCQEMNTHLVILETILLLFPSYHTVFEENHMFLGSVYFPLNLQLGNVNIRFLQNTENSYNSYKTLNLYTRLYISWLVFYCHTRYEEEKNFKIGLSLVRLTVVSYIIISYYLETKKILKTIILKDRTFDANVADTTFTIS